MREGFQDNHSLRQFIELFAGARGEVKLPGFTPGHHSVIFHFGF